jgi:hypothetical protein
MSENESPLAFQGEREMMTGGGPSAMCIICLEFQRTKDLVDARRMLEAARREPTAIDQKHLDEVEETLEKAKKAQAAGENP